MDVTVDCERCSGPILFGDRKCAGCDAIVSTELRLALETRLESASVEFRELKASARSAAVILLILAIGHIFIGAFLYWAGTAADLAGGGQENATANALLASNLAIGALYFGCYKWADHQPVAALVASVAILIGTRAFATAVSPLSLFAGLWVNLAVLVLLGRGLWSARKAGRLTKQFQLREAQKVS